jgi:hypothetical protein
MTTTIKLNRWWRCDRWHRVLRAVLIVKLPHHMEDIHMLPQDVEDACGIAKHLKMGAKEKDGEVHLEEAADWYTENNKIWLEEDLQEVLKVIGLEDLEAWKKKYNITTSNNQLKLEMLLLINHINKSDLSEYGDTKGYLTLSKDVDESIKKITDDQKIKRPPMCLCGRCEI